MCVDFCSKCVEVSSVLCQDVVKTCQCEISNATDDQVAAGSSAIMTTNFASPQEGQKQDVAAIVNVNFGKKGDAEYSAVLKEDGSYENEKKNSPVVWVVLGAIVAALTVLVIVID